MSRRGERGVGPAPRCADCGGETSPARLATYDARALFGLPVVLENVPVAKCRACGAAMLAGWALDYAGQHLALELAAQRDLDGAEVRYLRKFLGLTQEGLAGKLSVERITVGRWERGETRIEGPAGLALRSLVVFRVQDLAPSHPALAGARLATVDPAKRAKRARHRVDVRRLAVAA